MLKKYILTRIQIETPKSGYFSLKYMAIQFILPGATALGLTYNGGVILAAEKRISYGNFVVNKNTKKIFPVTDRVVDLRGYGGRYASVNKTSNSACKNKKIGN